MKSPLKLTWSYALLITAKQIKMVQPVFSTPVVKIKLKYECQTVHDYTSVITARGLKRAKLKWLLLKTALKCP